jgi:transketolase
MRNYRRIIVDKLIPYAKQDERIVLLVSDMGFGVADEFRKQLPDRIFNVGIMEQGSVSIAAGMAMTGLVPVFYSIVNFLVYRALEQVRNDVVLQNLNVKFVSTGVEDYFKMLGPSHTCGHDDIKLMNMINMPVYNPYESENVDFDKMFDEWITSEKAGYIRI